MKNITCQKSFVNLCHVVLIFPCCFILCLGQFNKRVEFKAEQEDASATVLEFVNIAVEKQRNGNVYVGARNRLYQLDSRLRNYFTPIVTGPVEDNIICKCEKKDLTDNINKLLLIDYRHNRIISCGSVEQGVCDLRQQDNLKIVLSNTNISSKASTQLVAAKGDLSTVGFTATSSKGKTYLFVGSSKTVQDEFVLKDVLDSSFYTVSKRYLAQDNLNHDMFSVLLSPDESSTGDDVGVRMKDSNYAYEDFRINFVDSFATNFTGYFVLTHPASREGGFKTGDHMTYISQFCLEHTTQDIHSYLELPLECSVDGIKYNKAVASRTARVGSILKAQLGLRSNRNGEPTDVVFISFVQNNGQPGSAVCMFTLREIETKFMQLINRCMKNSQGPPPKVISWIKSTSADCGVGEFVAQSPVCKNGVWWDIIKHLEDRIMTKNAVFMTNDSVITAIEVTESKNMDHTVAFFGCDDGKMLKVQLDANTMGSPNNVHYETVVILKPSDSILDNPEKSLSTVKTIRLGYIDSTGSQRVYAMTPGIIVGLPLFDCSHYTDCEACLRSRDPFCGWCTLESRCTSTENCPRYRSNSHRFIDSGGSCPRLESNLPLMLTASDSQKQLILKGYNLPFLKNRYSCSFGNLYTQRATNVRKLNNVRGFPIQIQCVSPPKSAVPESELQKGYLTIPLSLVFGSSSSTRKIITSANFTFYKCSVYSSCMSCVSANFNCAWCLSDSVCTHQSSTYCPQTNVKKTDSCPQLTAFSNGSNKVYLPEGQSTSIVLPASMLPDRWTSFRCEIRMKNSNQPIFTPARRERSPSAIRCIDVVGSLPVSMRSAEASLRVTTDEPDKDPIEIDNPHNVKVEIYRCELEPEGNCGTCLQSHVMWECGWCETTNTCSLRDGCSSWLEASKHRSCRNPEIENFLPSSAPFGGNSTIVKLSGVNFDRNGNMRISVAGVKCRLLGSNCCEAECVAMSKSVVSDPVDLCISKSEYSCIAGDDYRTSTSELFHFVDPKIASFAPSSGLKGWGTLIVVKGEHLNTGNSAVVNVDEQPCVVERRTQSRLECRLQCAPRDRSRRDVASSALRKLIRAKRSSFTTERRLTATFDGVLRVSKSGFFDFVDDVTISNVEPSTTIRSGGLPLNVTGHNLNLIQNPRIKVILPNGDKYRSGCHRDKETLVCTSPDVSESNYFRSKDSRARARVEIESADCGLRSVRYDANLIYDVDPVLNNFEGDEDTKVFRDEPIYITGSNLCPDRFYCDPKTVLVMIGEDMRCNVTRLDAYQITCESGPAEIGSYPVVVFVGGYSQSIGFLEYQEQIESPVLIIGIVVGIAIVLVLAILSVVCIYRRRAKESDQELKNVQMQMNVMESKVAKVCKEAFAELQTDMFELDMFAAGVGIPYLEYRVYLMRVLFPDSSSSRRQHSLLLANHLDGNDSRSSSIRSLPQRGRMGMDRFNQLLQNKIFLLSFIKAIEKQNSFSMRDRAQVAGLLFVILQNRLPYATEILEDLLADLIRKNIESRSHPKLLLRRSESVAEKMLTHWFSILLYRFVIDCAGEPLFTLFRAIKQQVDKGPLDAFTSEARYSLSEDKLLRQTMDHETIILRVTNYIADRDQPDFTVKVLSCDSISQVKRKVLDVAYMNHPYSYRPHPENVDLEWVREKQLPYILRDEDNSSKIDGDWKRVNTLAHYSVETNCAISLIPKRDPSLLNYSLMSNSSKTSSLLHKHNGSGSRLLQQSEGGSLQRYKQQTVGRADTPVLPPDGSKLWHLVKPNDQDQREDRENKMVSEIYLARLLTAKGTIQKYVDDLFETIFSVAQRGHALPLAIKHMFDFLDHQADIHGITDPDIVHTWKSNCLPLRFWVNLIKNPEFVYDIHKSPIVDCYLSVIAQAFMDSCSTAEYKLDKDSPSNKLLYAKEIPEYREWVKSYYAEISKMPRLNPRELSAFLQNESNMHSQDFNSLAALSQLYSYVHKYSDDLLTVLDQNPEARRQQLVKQVHDLTVTLNGGT